MGIKISRWDTGILRKKSSSAKDFPEDGWQDARNAMPVGREIVRRWGTSPWLDLPSGITGTTLHSQAEYYNNGFYYIFQHWDDTLYYYRKDATGSTPLVTSVEGLSDVDSVIFQVGKHLMFCTDSEDVNGHPYNFLIYPIGNLFGQRRAGVPQFSATNHGNVADSIISAGVGDINAGTYRYMFTQAVYDGSTMLTEGGGFDELALDPIQVVLPSASNIRLTFSGSLLSTNLMSHITHINIFRSLDLSGVWNTDETHQDEFKETPIWPYFRFVGKVAVDPSPYTFDDDTPDSELKQVSDTYDTRGWEPLPRAKYGMANPRGRIFVMNSEFPGRVYYTQNSISPNGDITKYYESYPAGFGYWYDVGLDKEQVDRGLTMSPTGDVLIMQDSRMYKFTQGDPLRTNFLGELKGNPAVEVDSSHGCKNIKACAFGADGYLYILGNHGYRAFDGYRFVGPNYLEDANLEFLDADNVNAVYYPGERFKDRNGNNGVNQIILSYPTTDGGDPDECLVILFREGKKVVTTYSGFKMGAAILLPNKEGLVMLDLTDKRLYHVGDYNTDRTGEDGEDRIEWWFQTKDFSHDDQAYGLVLDRVGAYGSNLDSEFEIRPVFDDVPRLNRQIVTPNIDTVSSPSFGVRNLKRYEKEFDDDSYGHLISIIFFSRSLEPATLESVDLNFLVGERMV